MGTMSFAKSCTIGLDLEHQRGDNAASSKSFEAAASISRVDVRMYSLARWHARARSNRLPAIVIRVGAMSILVLVSVAMFITSHEDAFSRVKCNHDRE